MRKFILLVIVTALAFSSCEIKVKEEKAAETSSKIRNGIVVKSKGIKIEQAFLLFEDGTRVPEDNIVQVNQKVIMRLIVSGWKEKDGKVFLSAGETMETSEGEVFLKEDDLYKDYKEGISPKDAEYLSLSVVINELTRLYDYFKVSFIVKDDSNPGSFAEGHYKLYIK